MAELSPGLLVVVYVYFDGVLMVSNCTKLYVLYSFSLRLVQLEHGIVPVLC